MQHFPNILRINKKFVLAYGLNWAEGANIPPDSFCFMVFFIVSLVLVPGTQYQVASSD